MKRLDLTNRRFGKWTVLTYMGNKGWACICDCGTEKVVGTGNLTLGLSKQCADCRSRGLVKKDSGIRLLFNQYKTGAKSRNFSWNLTREDFLTLTQGDCHYCGAVPASVVNKIKHRIPYIYNGIDRVDSQQGYDPANCVSCCESCNWMKSDNDATVFVDHAAVITSHQIPEYGISGC